MVCEARKCWLCGSCSLLVTRWGSKGLDFKSTCWTHYGAGTTPYSPPLTKTYMRLNWEGPILVATSPVTRKITYWVMNQTVLIYAHVQGLCLEFWLIWTCANLLFKWWNRLESLKAILVQTVWCHSSWISIIYSIRIKQAALLENQARILKTINWLLTWMQIEQNTNVRHRTPSLKPHTKCLIKKKIVCGSSEYCPKYRATDSWKKEKVWTKGLFVSFRMPFCITAYLKASYIPDVLDWPRTPPPPLPHTHTQPATRTPDSSVPLLPQPSFHRSSEKQAISQNH